MRRHGVMLPASVPLLPALAGDRRLASPSGRPGPPLGYFPVLELSHPQGLVTTRVGRPPETDLVPRPGVGVERRAGVACPQRPDMGAGDPVPQLGVLHRLDDSGLLLGVEVVEALAVPVVGVPVEKGQGQPPCLSVLGQVVVEPSVRLVESKPVVDQLEDGHLGGLPLVEEQIEQRAGRRLLVLGEETELRGRCQPGQDHTGRLLVPVLDLDQDVEPGEPSPSPRGDAPVSRSQRAHYSPSRRSSVASRPIPPTIEASNGAKTGGPISRL